MQAPDPRPRKIPSHFTTTKLRALALGVSLLILPRLAAAQCTPVLTSVSVSPSSIISLTTPPTGTANGTVTMSCALPPGYGNIAIDLTTSPATGLGCGGPIFVLPGNNTATFSCTASQVAQTTG
jgi:hypothetical protein